jgi:hypothetical protein
MTTRANAPNQVQHHIALLAVFLLACPCKPVCLIDVLLPLFFIAHGNT